ncbi:hypothetical protein EJB05_55901, partial [Eragrostis curvula]
MVKEGPTTQGWRAKITNTRLEGLNDTRPKLLFHFQKTPGPSWLVGLGTRQYLRHFGHRPGGATNRRRRQLLLQPEVGLGIWALGAQLLSLAIPPVWRPHFGSTPAQLFSEMKRYYQPVPKGNRENAASKNPEPQNKLARAEVGFQVDPPKGSNNREMEHSKIFDSKRRSASPAASSNCSESGNPYEVCLRISLVCARYLLRQGIPFYHIDPSYTWDKGHFLEMVDWYQGFDKNVKRAFDMLGPDRCHEMASIQFQKDMVKACAEEVAQAIREEIGDSRFSVLIDDTTDISNKEQMGIILRFVNKQGKVIERFLGLEWVNDTTPTAIKGYLVGLLARHGLSISRI